MPLCPATDVAIIGGGASGVLLAAQLVRQGAAQVRVTLFDRGPDVGLGIAYRTRCMSHILNVRASDMSALAEEPDHFVRWLAAGNGNPGVDGFVPRPTYGRYLRALLASTVQQSGGTLDVVAAEVTAVTELSDGVELVIGGSPPRRARIAVLATGQRAPAADRGAFYGNPWRDEVLDDLPCTASVLLIGTGLTMVDVVISLKERGHTGPITALSRRGLLPRRHPTTSNKVISGDQAALFGGPLSKRLAEFRAMTDRGATWQAITQALRPHGSKLWQSLDGPQKSRFLRHLRPWWDVHRHRVAPRVGQAIDDAIDCGQLSIQAGRVRIVEVRPDEARVSITRRGSAQSDVQRFDRVIDCSGPRSDVDSQRPPQGQMTRDGSLRPDCLHLGVDVNEDDALIAASGVPSTRLYALGPPTRGRHWEIVAIPDIRQRAASMAERLIRQVPHLGQRTS